MSNVQLYAIKEYFEKNSPSTFLRCLVGRIREDNVVEFLQKKGIKITNELFDECRMGDSFYIQRGGGVALWIEPVAKKPPPVKQMSELVARIEMELETTNVDIDQYEKMDEGCEPDHSVALGWDEALNWVLNQIKEIT